MSGWTTKTTKEPSTTENDIDKWIDVVILHMRRCNDAIYFSDNVLEKLIKGEDLCWVEIVGMFYPVDSNPKQYMCTMVFFQELLKQGVLRNDQLKQLFPDKKDYLMFLSHILPKMQKFRAIQSTGGKNAKKYELRFDKDFCEILEYTLRNWIFKIARSLTLD